MSHLADWFAGIDKQPPAPVLPARHADNVAVFAGAAGVGVPAAADPLALPYCVDSGQELHGAVQDAGGLLPLRCRGCRQLGQGRCEVLAVVPELDSAALCRRFVPRAGIKVGRCWLYRVTLEGGRLVWWSSTPSTGHAEAVRCVRLLYGDAVKEVMPLPGWVAMPGV